MSKVKECLLVFIVLLLLTSCAKLPTDSEIQNADYGPYPENYQEIIKNYYSEKLYDPYSAMYTFRKGPEKSFMRTFNGIVYLWRVTGTVNGKNKFGGYVGAKPFEVYIKHGVVFSEVPPY